LPWTRYSNDLYATRLIFQQLNAITINLNLITVIAFSNFLKKRTIQ